ncbi:DUF1906 domain-containing protein [Bifidobacterium sp. LC6]|uniref:DUF1906 domain-containing protein n=1 Tax=Bifidobacterium colobi TaxID=2809026 RepID=A0ABS5UVD5_9BIFI|nr:glycoside hydrolase domain-containing protein [Bifidobacterium colobi]MBT1175071.1 DUF1906 domain-containing protein [Bifidobacterium colobi]
MVDQMVLQTQQWLNKTYGKDSRFNAVSENGQTGWETIYGLTRALQIELGIQTTADNFGPSTQSLFAKRYPNGVQQQKDGDGAKSNVYSIIQGALWCKGYSTGSNISQHFYSGTGSAIKDLKTDMGIGGDTRFEITAERLATLKADGYRIVGRYLTEPGQNKLDPSEYFKAIRPGELERITAGGMQFFPIFQEYSTKLSHFTVENGRKHAQSAREAAQRLGIPPTYIYFAVDFDATDDQVSSTILPYFRAILSSLGGGYKVGIYASRNICTRIIEAGCAGCAFVSDMSTGFSGNLGFPIPNDWVYDQFTEISNYRGQGWDLASTMSNIQDVMDWNPDADLHAVCEALVGQDETYLSHPGIANLITGKYVNGVWKSISNSCNRDDLCCDGDAIRFAQVLSAGNGESTHLLSQTMRDYYNDAGLLANRFKQIAWSMGATNQNDAATAFRTKVDWGNGILKWSIIGEVSADVINASCKALADYIF